jgi:Tfp pilus assembly protein PilV
MSRRPLRSLMRGTSLVEAVVAMAVMAFGMLAVVGIQSTLRLNADVAKQRSEAVRIAQEAMETARGFAAIDDPAVGQTAYADIGSSTTSAVEGYTTNTTFTLTQTVTQHLQPPRKDIRIRVDWTDRNGQAQGVELNSIVGANDPLLALLLGARPNGIPLRQPLGRHPGVPPSAKSLPGGVSGFKPPSPDGQVVWVFDDASGQIVGVCNTVTTGQAELTGADISSCSNNASALLLSGFVRFATEAQQPTAADAENPASNALNLGVALTLVSSGHPTPNHVCFAAAPSSQSLALLSIEVPYYCIVFTNSSGLWSGRSNIVPLAFSEQPDSPWQIADDAADARADRYRVCRYTPATSQDQPVPNVAHPRTYIDVRTTLLNQNFLVIRAGDGTLAFTCPTDGPIDPATGNLVNSNTLVQQPPPT